MKTRPIDLTIRESIAADTVALCDILNNIIQIGGTTAHEDLYSIEAFEQSYLTGDDVITCVTALDDNDSPMGFQSVKVSPALPDGWGDIATFTRTGSATKGVGTALFKKTRGLTTTLNLEALNATIRADNSGGLAYYDKMGFVDYDRHLAKPLKDGTRIDRICKRFLLKWY